MGRVGRLFGVGDLWEVLRFGFVFGCFSWVSFFFCSSLRLWSECSSFVFGRLGGRGGGRVFFINLSS